MSGKHLSPTPPDVSGGVEEKMYTRGLAQGGPEWLSLVGTVDADVQVLLRVLIVRVLVRIIVSVLAIGPAL